MASESRPSAENSEEVRRQLKKTSIEEEQAMSIPPAQDQAGQDDATEAATTNGDHKDTETRGALRRKRSHEEIEGEATVDPEIAKLGKHARKRSRSADQEDTVADKPPSSQDTVEDPSLPALAASQAALSQAEAAANGSIYARTQTPDPGVIEEEKETSLLSPKNKRTRDEFLQTSVANEATEKADEGGHTTSIEGSSKPAKRARDSNSPQPDNDTAATATEDKAKTAVPPTSGFSNTSATSPFATVTSPKSPKPSASAFASSGFGAFASASASPFAAAGPAAGSASPFGGFGGKPSLAPPTSGKENDKPSASPFGGALGTTAGNASPFATQGAPSAFGGSTTSGFGGLGGGSTIGFGGLGSGSAFGGGFAAVKSGAGISSFATPGASGITGLSSKPSKPFGATADDEEEEDKEDGDDEPNAEETEAGIKSPTTLLDTDKKDKRFFQQSIETGEENETTIFTARCKLFVNDGTGWKERGQGALKVNTSSADWNDDGTSKTKARLLMRADGSQRVMLNAPIQKSLSYGNPKGEKPNSTQGFIFAAEFEGDIRPHNLKMKQHNKEELWEHIQALKEEI